MASAHIKIMAGAFCLFTGLCAGAAETPRKNAEAVWFASWDKAAVAAKESGKPILADFTGSDWCGWCIRLDDEVFATQEFGAWARQNVILLKLDFPHQKEQDAELKKQNSSLAQKYGIRGFPTVLFLDAEGTPLGKAGYLPGGPCKWLECAGQLLTKK